MKLIFIGIATLLVGCAQLMNGQIQPVVMKKQNVYYTTCSGAAESTAGCNKKAMATCNNGYLEIERYQDPNGAIRSLTFECKK